MRIWVSRATLTDRVERTIAVVRGSSNCGKQIGKNVVRINMKDRNRNGEYEDLLTGFVLDDGSNTLWRVAHARSCL
jgi:hypothetical protein